jgi:hypothetical protein
LDASSDYTGPALKFGVTGDGVSIDPETGILTVQTDKLREGVTITVTGPDDEGTGSVTRRFRLALQGEAEEPGTEEPPAEEPPAEEPPVEEPPAPQPLRPEQATLVLLADLDPEATGLHLGLRITDPAHPLHPAAGGIGQLAWTDRDPTGRDAATQGNKAVPARNFANPGHPHYGVWALTRRVSGSLAPWADRTGQLGDSHALAFAWAADPATTPAAAAAWNAWSPVFPAFVLALESDEPDAGDGDPGNAPGEEPPVVPPVVVATPALVGTGVIGAAVTVEPGTWSGTPRLDLHWLRDGAEIAGATGSAYTPVAADDRCALACAVTATNPGGSVRVETAALAVAYAPPVATGSLFDEVFDKDTGVQVVEAGPAFAGEALVFAVEGAGATIDPATGRLTLPTDTALSAEVTVTAANSGGSASLAFQVTVEDTPVETPMPALGTGNAALVLLADLDPEATGLHLGLRITDPAHPLHPAAGGRAAQLAWTDRDPIGRDPATQANKAVPARRFATAGDPQYGVWALSRKASGSLADWADRSTQIGDSHSLAFTWSDDDPTTTPATEAVWAAWGEALSFTFVAAEGVTPNPEPEPEPEPQTPPPSRAGSKRMPFQNEAEWLASQRNGYIGGDALQLMTWVEQSRSNPNYIVKTQDMGGPWVSLDHGRSWWKPRCKGLFTQLMNSVGIDPVNERHWIVVGTGAFAGVRQHQGLYRTTDGGATFSRVHVYTGVEGKNLGGMIAAAPSSVSGARSQRWYAIVNQVDPGSGGVTRSTYFLRSSDGGATWTNVVSLSLSTYGNINQVRVHPTDQNVVFFASSTGLWRVDAAGSPNPTFTKLSPGLSGGFSTLPYLEMVGGTLHMVVGNGGGVRRSTNGGSTWSTVSTQSVSRLFVSRWEPDFMVAVGRAGRPLVRTGGAFSESAVMPARPGYPPTTSPAETSASWIMFSPNRGEMYFKARGIVLQNADYRSSDYGALWTISNDYFSGTQSQVSLATGQGFSKDRNYWGVGIVDAGICVTPSGGRYWERSEIPANALTSFGIGHRSCTAFALHPDYPAVPRIMAIMDRTSGGKFVMCNRRDLTQWYQPAGVSSSSSKARFVGWDVSNPQFAYALRSRSTDGGATFSPMAALPTNFEVWGMTRSAPLANGQAVFAFDNEGTAQRVARSLDRGASWQVLLDFGARLLNLPGAEAAGTLLPHPSNHDRLFVRGGGSQVRLYRLNEGSGTSRPYTTIECAPASIRIQLAPGAAFELGNFAIDPRHPDRIWYATNGNPGTGVPLVRTTDGGATWENLAGLVPDNNLSFTDVHPLTGDVIQTTSNGAFVIAPPYAQATSIHGGLVQPNRVI